MEGVRATFSKRERLVSQRLIEMLFGQSANKSLAAFPLRVVYHLRKRQEGDEPVQMLVSVPKKRFHHAVDRNRVKRQVRAMCDNALTYDAQSLDIVIIVKNKFVTSNFNDNESQLRDLFTKHVGV